MSVKYGGDTYLDITFSDDPFNETVSLEYDANNTHHNGTITFGSTIEYNNVTFSENEYVMYSYYNSLPHILKIFIKSEATNISLEMNGVAVAVGNT